MAVNLIDSRPESCPDSVYLSSPHKPDPGHIKGLQSESTVLESIQLLEEVEEVRRVPWGSEEDSQMRDLKVVFRPRGDGTRRDPVAIQVKSSERTMRDGMHKVTRRAGGEDPETFLARDRLLIINGGMQEGVPVTGEEIRARFIEQLQRMP